MVCMDGAHSRCQFWNARRGWATPSSVLGDLVEGALRLQGQGSAMLVQFSADGSVALQPDADGNGSYERTTNYATVQQLAVR